MQCVSVAGVGTGGERVDDGGDMVEVLLLLRHVTELVAMVAPMSPIEHVCTGIYLARCTCTAQG